MKQTDTLFHEEHLFPSQVKRMAGSWNQGRQMSQRVKQVPQRDLAFASCLLEHSHTRKAQLRTPRQSLMAHIPGHEQSWGYRIAAL